MPHCTGQPGNVVWAEGTPTLTLLGSVEALLGGAPQRVTRSLTPAWDDERRENDVRLRHTAPLSYARDHRGAPLSTARLWQQPSHTNTGRRRLKACVCGTERATAVSRPSSSHADTPRRCAAAASEGVRTPHDGRRLTHRYPGIG